MMPAKFFLVMKPLKLLVLLPIVMAAATGAYLNIRMVSDSWQPPRVVKIESKESLSSLFPAWLAWLTDAEGGMPQALLLRDGDHVFGGDTPFVYHASDGQVLKVSFNDWGVQIGETTVTVSLDKDEGLAWLNKASDRQLANLRTVSLPTEIGAETLVALKRLAAAKPNLNLFGGSEDVLLQALPLFQPRAVFLDDFSSAAILRALANQPQLEMLFMNASEAGSLEVLPTLPKLRRLVIGNWDIAKAGPLPAGLASLRTLLVLESKDVTDLSALRAAPPELEELSLIGLKGLTDLTGLDKMTGLRTLVLFGNEELGDLSDLAALKQLRWVGLPPKTSQEQFTAFVRTHPNLKILDLTGNETVQDLEPLGILKGLEGLILEGPYENLNALQRLTSLRFIGISKKTREASPEQVAALRKALPDALVVPVKPICVGSGWLLLLVPVLVVVWLLRRPRRVAQLV